VLSSEPQQIVFRNNPNIDKLTIIDQDLIPKASPESNQRWFEGRAKEFDFFA